MMRPEPGVGFRFDGLTYTYLAGWREEDIQIFSSFVTALTTDAGAWPQSAAHAVLLIWVEGGLPEKRYLR